MTVSQKLIASLIVIVLTSILVLMMRFINDGLKSRLERSNPQLVERAHWFFSNRKRRFVDFVIIVFALISIFLIWTNRVESIFTN